MCLKREPGKFLIRWFVVTCNLHGLNVSIIYPSTFDFGMKIAIIANFVPSFISLLRQIFDTTYQKSDTL